MSNKTIHFQHGGHVTKRTFRFAELDDEGNVLPKVDALVGTLYIKKSLFEGATPPKHVEMTIDW
jgi:hypothetical protein